jgi:endoglucanase
MTELLPFLKTLISAPGLSGHEMPIRNIIETAWQPLTDEIHTSRLGSLHGLKRGSGVEPRPAILLAAHMDAIGLMVTTQVGDFLRVTEVGGLDARVLAGQRVVVHGRQHLSGVIVHPPARLLPEDAREGPVALKYLLIDTGLREPDLKKLVRPGDLVAFAQEPLELRGETLAGHSLDNRASIAALTQCLQTLQGRAHVWDVWAVATVQEEVTMGGARTSAFGLRPQLAVAIDVTWGKGPGTPDYKTFPLGKGPTLGWGPNIHPGFHKAFKQVADRLETPYAIEVMPRHSGTDAFGLQIAAEGIACMVVSIPLRYMHTPVEVVALKDISRTGQLLAEFIAGLQPDFMDTLTLDEKS